MTAFNVSKFLPGATTFPYFQGRALHRCRKTFFFNANQCPSSFGACSHTFHPSATSYPERLGRFLMNLCSSSTISSLGNVFSPLFQECFSVACIVLLGLTLPSHFVPQPPPTWCNCNRGFQLLFTFSSPTSTLWQPSFLKKWNHARHLHPNALSLLLLPSRLLYLATSTLSFHLCRIRAALIRFPSVKHKNKNFHNPQEQTAHPILWVILQRHFPTTSTPYFLF